MTQCLKSWCCFWNEGGGGGDLPECTDPARVQFGVCEAARAAGQWRQTGRETEVI